MNKNLEPKGNNEPPIRQESKADFKPVSCLLAADELDEKCDEQFGVTWNGANVPP